MRNLTCLVALVLVGAAPAAAQLVENPENIRPQGPALENGLKVISMEAVDLTIPLSDAQRVPYILRQARLTDEQKAKIKPMLAEYLTAPEAVERETARRAQVKALRAEQKDARGKQQRDQLEEQIQEVQQQRADRRFFAAIKPLLTDQQRAALDAAERRVENNLESAAIRPLDIIRAAEQTGLTADQLKQVRQAANHFRRDINMGLAMSAERRVVFIAALLERVRPILTDAQRPQFEQTIELLRVDRLPEAELLPL